MRALLLAVVLLGGCVAPGERVEHGNSIRRWRDSTTGVTCYTVDASYKATGGYAISCVKP